MTEAPDELGEAERSRLVVCVLSATWNFQLAFLWQVAAAFVVRTRIAKLRQETLGGWRQR